MEQGKAMGLAFMAYLAGFSHVGRQLRFRGSPMKANTARHAIGLEAPEGRHVAPTFDGITASHPQLSPVLTAEMSRLFSLGFSLLPLGGSDGKKPIVSFKDKKRLPLSTVVDRMGAAASASYGIRLNDVVVVDVDTDTPEARAYVERRFGCSPCRTRTGRGFHHYYRSNGTIPAGVRLPGIAIDFKSGGNAFVVGPQSERPDKVVYWPEARLVAPEELPLLDDREALGQALPTGLARAKPPATFPKGTRWSAIKKQARLLALRSHQFGDLFQGLKEFRDERVEQPQEFPDPSIEDLAHWFWDKKESGQLWVADNSTVQVPRQVIGTLAAQGHFVALALYGVLLSVHGHRPSNNFVIVPDGLRKVRLKAGRKQIYAAIEVLRNLGLLNRTSNGGKGRPARYRLGFETTEEKIERGEEGVFPYICTLSEHKPPSRGMT